MSIILNWPDTTGNQQLSEGQVDLWAINIDGPKTPPDRLLTNLSEDEHRRANRFRFESPKHRFIVARAALRKIIASYLAIRPDEVQFIYDGLGKPALAPRVHGNMLRFNLSHSAGLAVLAVTKNCDVGVDVEKIRTVRHATGIAQRYFNTSEVEEVLNYTGAIEESFFRCWTRKEAVVKTVGTGLQYPLEQFCVPVQDNSADWVALPAHRDLQSCEVWLEPFVPCEGFLGAVSILGEKRVSNFASYQL